MANVEKFGRVVLDRRTAYARFEGERAHLLDEAPWAGGRETGEALPLADVKLAVPCQPSKILCVGRNYLAHAKELGSDLPSEPLLFAKPPSSLLDPGGTTLLPPESSRVDYEGELGVVIGTRCRRVSAADALRHVFGYTVVCDVTARDLQKRDGQWTRAKGFDTFCPVGPWIARGLDPQALPLQLEVNGERRQDSETSRMIFSVARIVEYASAAMTLEPGDLIATGTPEGVGPLASGDAVLVRVEGIGELRFSVAAER